MTLDLSDYTQPEHIGCLSACEITDHADLWVLTHLADNRALVAHLLRTAADLTVAAQTLMRLFLEDGYDHTTGTAGDGYTDHQRHQLLTLVSTCTYNANLFVQEARRRRMKRVHAGWDPITTPVTV
jgi:hypothetical protein